MWFIGILLICFLPIIYNEVMEFLTHKSGYGKRGILKDDNSKNIEKRDKNRGDYTQGCIKNAQRI